MTKEYLNKGSGVTSKQKISLKFSFKKAKNKSLLKLKFHRFIAVSLKNIV